MKVKRKIKHTHPYVLCECYDGKGTFVAEHRQSIAHKERKKGFSLEYQMAMHDLIN